MEALKKKHEQRMARDEKFRLQSWSSAKHVVYGNNSAGVDKKDAYEEGYCSICDGHLSQPSRAKTSGLDRFTFLLDDLNIPNDATKINALTVAQLKKIVDDMGRDGRDCSSAQALRCRAGLTVVIGTCHHSFHETCLKKEWGQSTCPVCKVPFKVEKTVNVAQYAQDHRLQSASFSTKKLEEVHVGNSMELGELGQVLTNLLAGMGSGPKTWDTMRPGQNDALVELPSWCDEYKEANRLFRKSVTNKTMVKIERVQNSFLYRRYIMCKMKILSKNGGLLNERLLFHGTRATKPGYIWDGLNAGGFDPRLGKGYYGIGAYFAEKASYSLAYQYRGLGGGLCQMFLASVITGESKDYKTTLAQGLKRAPDLPDSHPRHPGLYDSVKAGPHSGSIMYIVYEADMSLPLYLYTYK